MYAVGLSCLREAAQTEAEGALTPNLRGRRFGVQRRLLSTVAAFTLLLGVAAAAPAPAAAAGSTFLLPVPKMLQADSLWANDKLGTTTDTLGSQGCAVTSLAMVYAFAGGSINDAKGIGMDPSILNVWLGSRANSMAWTSVDVPSGLGSLAKNNFSSAYSTYAALSSSGYLPAITNQLAAGRPVIAWVTSPIQSMHFVVITGWTGSNLNINDPANRTTLLFSTYTIHGIRTFIPSSPTATVDDTSPTGFALSGPWSNIRRPGYSAQLKWTTTLGPGNSDTAYAMWMATLTATGWWEASVWVPSSYSTATNATYSIACTGMASSVKVVISQLPYSAVWVSLGSYYCPAGPTTVYLGNVTGAAGARLAADAVKWVKTA